MNSEIILLSVTAASIGLVHTVLGPDHYLPFIMMSKARNWPLPKTMLITLLCGAGHIMSSVVLGLLGVICGLALTRLESLEAFRGNLAAWGLIGFGFAYMLWGIRQAWKNRPHRHLHHHEKGQEHAHAHTHHDEHGHLHRQDKKNITPWVLFTIFVLGPCEPLIPILMYPAAKQSWWGLVSVTAVFGLVTIITMSLIVLAASWGFSFARLGKMERFTHAFAGGTICLSGLAIQVLGL